MVKYVGSIGPLLQWTHKQNINTVNIEWTYTPFNYTLSTWFKQTQKAAVFKSEGKKTLLKKHQSELGIKCHVYSRIFKTQTPTRTENMVQISGLENMVQISGFELSVVKLMQCYRYFSKTNNNRFQIMGHLRFFTCF